MAGTSARPGSHAASSARKAATPSASIASRSVSGAFAFADQRVPSTAVIAPSASTTGVVRTALVTASRKAGSAIVEASAAGSSPASTTAVAPARVLFDQPLLPWTTVVTVPPQPAFLTACA